jgi:hypothetical protein
VPGAAAANGNVVEVVLSGAFGVAGTGWGATDVVDDPAVTDGICDPFFTGKVDAVADRVGVIWVNAPVVDAAAVLLPEAPGTTRTSRVFGDLVAVRPTAATLDPATRVIATTATVIHLVRNIWSLLPPDRPRVKVRGENGIAQDDYFRLVTE